MTKGQKSSLFAIVVLIFLSFWWVIKTGQQPATPANSERAAKSRACNQEQKEWEPVWEGSTCFIRRAGSDPIAVLTVALIFVAAVQGGLFLVQLIFMRRGLDDARIAANAARDAARATEDSLKFNRAWMCYSSVQVVPASGVESTGRQIEDGMSIVIIWENCGNTPAFVDHVFTDIKICSFQSPVPVFNISNNHIETKRGVIAPKKTVSGIRKMLDDAQYAQFRDRNCKVFVYSKVIYFDIFEKTESRVSEACLQLIWDGFVTQIQGGPLIPTTSVSMVGRQNTAT